MASELATRGREWPVLRTVRAGALHNSTNGLNRPPNPREPRGGRGSNFKVKINIQPEQAAARL